jgi:hypothetical protein
MLRPESPTLAYRFVEVIELAERKGSPVGQRPIPAFRAAEILSRYLGRVGD